MTHHLVQILLPTADNQGQKFPSRYWESLKMTLADTFGGVTAYHYAPAEGIWAPDAQEISKERVFIVEIMTDTVDEIWWSELRSQLERDLDQEQIVIRALPFKKL